MQSGTGTRAGGARPGRANLVRVCAALAMASAVAGCVTDGTVANLSRPYGNTIAFESIDGPPPDVFHELVQALGAEADTRELAVVSRESNASYRVRAYLSAHVQKRQTSIAWAMDVYDSDQRRMLRLTGEEKAGAPGRNAWNGANTQVVRRIAQSGMEQLSARLGDGVRSAPAPAPTPADNTPETTIAVARADDFQPEAAGIFRIFRSDSAQPVENAVAADDVPLPRRRPVRPTRAAQAPTTQTLALAPQE